MAILSPALNAPGGYRGDREVERRLAQEVRDQLDRMLNERQLLSPRPEDRERILGLIHGHVESYQRQAAVSNGHLLRDPTATEKRIRDDILGLGILQSLMDDAEVEEIMAN